MGTSPLLLDFGLREPADSAELKDGFRLLDALGSEWDAPQMAGSICYDSLTAAIPIHDNDLVGLIRDVATNEKTHSGPVSAFGAITKRWSCHAGEEACAQSIHWQEQEGSLQETAAAGGPHLR